VLSWTKNSRSLPRFIASRLYIALFFITLVWGILATQSYHFALDDTAEFYLIEDAENALFFMSQGLGHDFVNSEFRQSYLTIEQLPADIKATVKANMPPVNQAILIASPLYDSYVLPYSSSGEIADIYIVHRFAKDDSINILPYQLLIGLLAFFTLALVVKFVVTRIGQQTQLMANKISRLTSASNGPESPLVFADYQYAFNVIEQYYQAQHQALSREKDFASFLSHELRQPLARMANNLSLLDQIDQLPLRSLAVIDDMKLTNKALSQLTIMVLQLWQNSTEHKTSVEFTALLTEHLGLFDETRLTIETQIVASPVTIQANANMVALLLKQLLQNSKQYAATKVLIELSARQLKISNDVRTDSNATLSENSQIHGYGIGLVMVDKACQQLDWPWQQSAENNLFSVTVNFG
jgi:signal transduction histidine kinase